MAISCPLAGAPVGCMRKPCQAEGELQPPPAWPLTWTTAPTAPDVLERASFGEAVGPPQATRASDRPLTVTAHASPLVPRAGRSCAWGGSSRVLCPFTWGKPKWAGPGDASPRRRDCTGLAGDRQLPGARPSDLALARGTRHLHPVGLRPQPPIGVAGGHQVGEVERAGGEAGVVVGKTAATVVAAVLGFELAQRALAEARARAVAPSMMPLTRVPPSSKGEST